MEGQGQWRRGDMLILVGIKVGSEVGTSGALKYYVGTTGVVSVEDQNWLQRLSIALSMHISSVAGVMSSLNWEAQQQGCPC